MNLKIKYSHDQPSKQHVYTATALDGSAVSSSVSEYKLEGRSVSEVVRIVSVCMERVLNEAQSEKKPADTTINASDNSDAVAGGSDTSSSSTD